MPPRNPPSVQTLQTSKPPRLDSNMLNQAIIAPVEHAAPITNIRTAKAEKSPAAAEGTTKPLTILPTNPITKAIGKPTILRTKRMRKELFAESDLYSYMSTEVFFIRQSFVVPH